MLRAAYTRGAREAFAKFAEQPVPSKKVFKVTDTDTGLPKMPPPEDRKNLAELNSLGVEKPHDSLGIDAAKNAAATPAASKWLEDTMATAKRRGYSIFAVVEDPKHPDGGGSITSIKPGHSGDAIRNARKAHVKWEKANGFDPKHDWRAVTAADVGMAMSTARHEGPGAVRGEPADEGRRQKSVIDRAFQQNEDIGETSSMPRPAGGVYP